MTTYNLITTITIGSTTHYAGDVLDDAIRPVTITRIQAAGGVLIATGDATVDAAAAIARARRKNRAADERALDALMMTALALTRASVGSASPAAVGTQAVGTATAASREDHVHAHGNQLGGALHANADGTSAGFLTSAHFNKLNLNDKVRNVRGVVFANVADLANFTVASNDGLTYVAGDRVLLANQTTAAQNGIYLVGTVGGGTAPLTRAADMPATAAIVNGMTVEVSEGTIFAGSTWKAMCTGACVVATDDPLFYPRVCKGTLTLGSGTKSLGSPEGLYVFSTTKSAVLFGLNTPNTVTNTTAYCCPVAGVTAGKSGTAVATIRANVAAGSINVADLSTLWWQVTNW